MPGLTQQQVEVFHRQGYLHVEDALGPEDLDPVQEELEGMSFCPPPHRRVGLPLFPLPAGGEAVRGWGFSRG